MQKLIDKGINEWRAYKVIGREGETALLFGSHSVVAQIGIVDKDAKTKPMKLALVNQNRFVRNKVLKGAKN